MGIHPTTWVICVVDPKKIEHNLDDDLRSTLLVYLFGSYYIINDVEESLWNSEFHFGCGWLWILDVRNWWFGFKEDPTNESLAEFDGYQCVFLVLFIYTQKNSCIVNININTYVCIWVNYKIPPTWIKAIWGWFPLLTMIPLRLQWGRCNLPRCMSVCM